MVIFVVETNEPVMNDKNVKLCIPPSIHPSSLPTHSCSGAHPAVVRLKGATPCPVCQLSHCDTQPCNHTHTHSHLRKSPNNLLVWTKTTRKLSAKNYIKKGYFCKTVRCYQLWPLCQQIVFTVPEIRWFMKGWQNSWSCDKTSVVGGFNLILGFFPITLR